jgi:Glycosyl transferase WecG/TagA/CpsF family
MATLALASTTPGSTRRAPSPFLRWSGSAKPHSIVNQRWNGPEIRIQKGPLCFAFRRFAVATSELVGVAEAARARRLLKRQLSLPVSMMSQWCVSRSSNAVVILGSLKTLGHSPNAAKPDILRIGFGVPLEQKLAVRNRHRLHNVGLIKTSGGLFDVLCGSKSPAPQWIINTGFNGFTEYNIIYSGSQTRSLLPLSTPCE